MDYIDIINKAFRSILFELVKYIGKILSEKDNKKWWEKYVLEKLKETTTRNLPKNGTYDECINSLDIYACLLIIIANWEEIFKYKLECKLSYIHELKEIRHDTEGHTTLQILRKINKEYMDRALDTMALLMDNIDKITSDKIRSMKSYERTSEPPILEQTGKSPRIIPPVPIPENEKNKPRTKVKKSVKLTDLNYSIQKLSWQEFVEKIKNERHFTRRIEVIKIAKELFKKYNTYSEMKDDDRKFIAGLGYRNEPNEIITKDNDWLLFGSMKGFGIFRHEIIINNENISLALDQIPLNGSISKDNYSNFWEYYKKKFSTTSMASATRLLCMKRPDTFMCLDSANQSKLFRNFGIKGKVDEDFYWDEVIKRIKNCEWWKTNKPNNENWVYT